MKFSELVDQAGELLRRRERITYRALKREFDPAGVLNPGSMYADL